MKQQIYINNLINKIKMDKKKIIIAVSVIAVAVGGYMWWSKKKKAGASVPSTPVTK